MWSVSFSRDKSAAEKRRQLIQESKFLGGDMEHTHLVKGLDFALLQKVGLGWQVESNTAMLNALIRAFLGDEGDCSQFKPSKGLTVTLLQDQLLFVLQVSASVLSSWGSKPSHITQVWLSPHSLPPTTCTLVQLFCFIYSSYHILLFNCLICLHFFL